MAIRESSGEFRDPDEHIQPSVPQSEVGPHTIIPHASLGNVAFGRPDNELSGPLIKHPSSSPVAPDEYSAAIEFPPQYRPQEPEPDPDRPKEVNPHKLSGEALRKAIEGLDFTPSSEVPGAGAGGKPPTELPPTARGSGEGDEGHDEQKRIAYRGILRREGVRATDLEEMALTEGTVTEPSARGAVDQIESKALDVTMHKYRNFADVEEVSTGDSETTKKLSVFMTHTAEDGTYTHMTVGSDATVEVGLNLDASIETQVAFRYEKTEAGMVRTRSGEQPNLTGRSEGMFVAEAMDVAAPPIPSFGQVFDTARRHASGQELEMLVEGKLSEQPDEAKGRADVAALAHWIAAYEETGLAEWHEDVGMKIETRSLNPDESVVVAIGTEYASPEVEPTPYIKITHTRPSTSEEIVAAMKKEGITDPAEFRSNPRLIRTSLSVRYGMRVNEAGEPVAVEGQYGEGLIAIIPGDTPGGIDMRTVTLNNGTFSPVERDMPWLRNYVFGPTIES